MHSPVTIDGVVHGLIELILVRL